MPKPPKKRLRRCPSVGRKAFRVFVGEDSDPFFVHVDVIAKSSEFFNTFTGSNFVKVDGKVELPRQDPELFAVYVDWLYSGSTNTARKKLEPDAIGNYPKLAILADFLKDKEFGNAVIDGVITSMSQNGARSIEIAAKLCWDSLPATSKWRKLAVDIWVYCGRESWYEASPSVMAMAEAPQDFWISVGKTYAAYVMRMKRDYNLDPPRPWAVDRCQYHEHEDGKKCGDALAVNGDGEST